MSQGLHVSGSGMSIDLCGSFATRHVPIFFSQSGRAQAEWQGCVIMTNLRALVGTCFLLAVMAFVVFVPFGWALVLVAASTVTP